MKILQVVHAAVTAVLLVLVLVFMSKVGALERDVALILEIRQAVDGFATPAREPPWPTNVQPREGTEGVYDSVRGIEKGMFYAPEAEESASKTVESTADGKQEDSYFYVPEGMQTTPD